MNDEYTPSPPHTHTQRGERNLKKLKKYHLNTKRKIRYEKNGRKDIRANNLLIIT